MRVGVIGGSMAGLIVGLLLLRRGIDVTIFERSGDELSSRGAGITPHADLFAAFTEAGIDVNQTMGVESQGRWILDRAGEPLAHHSSQQTFTSWGLLYRILRDAFPFERYHNGLAVKQIRPTDSEVELILDNGTSERFSWVIGADGVRSRTRRFVSPKTTVQELDYVAWRGLVEESTIEPAIRDLLERGMTFFLPPGEHMLGYTVAGPDDTLERGHRYYNWVWYRPVITGQARRELFLGRNGESYPDGIPPTQIRPTIIDTMRHDAQRLLPPQFRQVVQKTAQPFIQPIVEVSSRNLVRSRCVLIGDAAFTARPHIGCGVSKAAGDASSLAAVLSSESVDFASTLQQWEHSRRRFGNAVVERSAALGCYLGSSQASRAVAGKERHYRNPQVVLEGIAAPDPYRFLTGWE